MADNKYRISIGATIDKQSYLKMVEDLKKFGKSVDIPINLDTNNLNKFLKSLNITRNTQGEITNEVQKYNVGLGQSLTITSKINKETNKLEVSSSKLIVNQEKIQKENNKRLQQLKKERDLQKQTREEEVKKYQTSKQEKYNAFVKQQVDLFKAKEISSEKFLQITKQLQSQEQRYSNLDLTTKKQLVTEIDKIIKAKQKETQEINNQLNATKKLLLEQVKLRESQLKREQGVSRPGAVGYVSSSIKNTPLNPTEKELYKTKNQQFTSWMMPNLDKTSETARESASAFDDLFKKSSKTQLGLSNIERQVVKLNPALKTGGQHALTYGENLAMITKKFADWLIVGTIIMTPINALRSMIRIVSEVDKALVDINKVMNLTNEQMKQLTTNATEVGKAYGRTTVEVLNATAAFARAGLGEKDAQNLAKLALLLGNVGDMTIDSAQETLIAANAGYQLGNSYEELLGIIDKLNEVSNKNATTVSAMADAWKVSASTAKMANLSIDEYTALVGTAQAVTQRSGSEIGNAWKTILMRLQGVSDGVDTLDEDLGRAEKSLNAVGIAVRKSPTEFRPVMEVLQELSMKFNELNDIEKSYVTESLAGKYRANILKSTLQNFSMVNKQLAESMNASGSSMQENARYLESIEAKTKQLIATWEQLSQTVMNSEWIKGVLDISKDSIEVFDRLIKQLGLLGTAFLFISSGALAKFVASIYSAAVGAGILETAIVALQLGVKGLSVSLLALLSNPVTWIIAAIGAVTAGIIYWSNKQQKLKEQTEQMNSAQKDFNQSLKEFQDTLDPSKIDQATQALERLKQAVDYEETLKKIAKLKEDMESMIPDSGRYKKAEIELKNLEEQISAVDEQQLKLNEAVKQANALDYESAQQSVNKIALKLQEVKANKELFNSYKSVYDKLKEGKELTKEETELNDRLIQQYPEYTRLLNEKTGALGVNYDALNANNDAQQALAIIELDRLKTSAAANIQFTETVIQQTQTRIKNIEAEIKALEAYQSAYAGAYGGSLDSVNEFATGKLIQSASAKIAQAKGMLEEAKITKQAYKTILGLNPKDLLKSNNKSGYIPPKTNDGENKDGSGGKSSTSSSLNDILKDELKYQNAITEAQNKSKNLTNEEYDERLKVLDAVEKADKNLLNYYESQRKVAKSKGLEDELNKKILDVQGNLAEIEKQRKEINEDILEYQQKQQKAVDDIIDSYQDYLTGVAQDEIDKLEKKKELAEKNAQIAKDAIQEEIDLLQDKNEEIKQEEERQQRLLDIAKQREKINNIQKERNVRLFQDGEWKWVADPRALREANEELSNMQSEYDKWEAENRRQKEIEKLEDKKEQIDEELKLELEGYDTSINQLQDFIDESKKEWEKQKGGIQSYNDLLAKLAPIEKKLWEDKVKDINATTNALNRLISTQAQTGYYAGGGSSIGDAVSTPSPSSPPTQGSSGGSSSSGGKTAKDDNIQPGQKIVSDGKVWQKQPDGSYNYIRDEKENDKWTENLPHYADGTNNHPGGWAVVGEKGKELVNLPTGSQVFPSDITSRILSLVKMPNLTGKTVNNNTEKSINIQNMTVISNDPQDFMQKLNRQISNLVAVKG